MATEEEVEVTVVLVEEIEAVADDTMGIIMILMGVVVTGERGGKRNSNYPNQV